MSSPKSLENLCLDVIYDDAAKKDRARLVSTLHGVIDVFKSRVIPSQSARSQCPQDEGKLLSHASESSQTTATNLSSKETQTDFNYEKLFENIEAKGMRLQLQIDESANERKVMAEVINEREAELNETLSELDRVSVELTRMKNVQKQNELSKKTYKSQTTATQTSGISEVTTSSPGAWSNQATSTHTTENGNYLVGHDASFSLLAQESLSETESLTSVPTTSGVGRNIYNNYQLLLLKLASGLLADEVDKLKQWVETEFQIHASGDVNTIFLELDRKKAINITDLSRLKKFFEDNVRYDLVHLVDNYILGEYEQLKSFKITAGSRIFGTQNGLTDRQSSNTCWPSRPNWSEIGHTSGISQRPTGSSLGTVPVHQRNFPGISCSNFLETQNGRTSSISTQFFTERYVPVSLDVSSGRGKEAVRNVDSSSSQGVDGGGTNGNETQGGRRARSTRARRDGADTSRNAERGSNGQKLSKFSQPDSSGNELDHNWLCSHFKRRCYVRIYGDRSLQCDVCGVCPDVQHGGNQKCRQGSPHDKCCICLEDAFTGCQILPCSHKVHKECATKMTRSGIRRCPICWECFAHKMERKLPHSKKSPGKRLIVYCSKCVF